MAIPPPPCERVREALLRPGARHWLIDHINACAECHIAAEPIFAELSAIFLDAHRRYQEVSAGFEVRLKALSRESEPPGTVDVSSALLLNFARAVNDDALRIYQHDRHDSLGAVRWLQYTFLACRAFECERLIEHKIAFENPKTRVGAAKVPDSPEKTWADVTAPSTMVRDHLRYGTFPFNFALQETIQAELTKKKFVHALVLICDPAKHGVMSPILNVVSAAHVEQIYALGFEAAISALHAFGEYLAPV